MTKKLLVIIPDRLSVLVSKGEVVPRYYNPGNVFSEVHILMTNEDQPDPKAVQLMVGDAKLYIHNHPEPHGFFKKTLGWQSWLIKNWLKQVAVKLAAHKPDVIRCHGAHLNLAIGAFLKQQWNIPLLVSLHTSPLLDTHKEKRTLKNKIINYFALKLYRNLKYADLVLPVYVGITFFLDNLNIKQYRVLYNQVGVDPSGIKTEYSFKDKFRLISIGQQIANKDPTNLILAVAKYNNVTLDIVGVGILNSSLKKLVEDLGAGDRIKFIDSIPHLKLCRQLKTYDCFASNIDCVGLSKTVIESFLCKLPVLLNINSHVQVPELNDSICIRVPDTIDGYSEGIDLIKNDIELRARMSEAAYKYAIERWDPLKIEQQHISIYNEYLTT